MNVFEASSDIAKYLSPGERVLWEGRGRGPSLLASSSGAAMVLGLVFAVGLAGLVIAVIASSRGEGGGNREIPVIIVSVIILAIILSVYIVVFVAVRRVSNILSAGTRYLVTSEAAIIFNESRRAKRVMVVPLKSVPVVSLTENRDGTGTLVFGQNPFFANVWYAGGRGMDALPAFWNVERPLEVYQLIRRQMTAD